MTTQPSIIRKSFLALASCLIAMTMTASPAAAEQQVIFNPFPSGLAAKLVDQAWRKVPEYQSYIKETTMVPDYMLGLADVNGDGTPEIFARHSDDIIGFCDPTGRTCRLHIYAYTSKGLFEIGRFMAGDVTISDSKTQNINDLIVENVNGGEDVYVWNGKRYTKP